MAPLLPESSQEIDLFEAHPLDDPGVVRSEERLDLEAGGPFHVGEEGDPADCLRFWEDSVEMMPKFRTSAALAQTEPPRHDGRRRNGDQET